MFTEPDKHEDDIEEQSTYEIADENVDYVNITKRQNSSSKLPNYKAPHLIPANITASK